LKPNNKYQMFHPVGMVAGNVATDVDFKGFLPSEMTSKHADICSTRCDSYGERPYFWKNFRTEIFIDFEAI